MVGGWYSNPTMRRTLLSASYKAIQSSRLYEQIVQQIEDSIMKGDLKTGDQLPAERELADQFGVSRTAVREAVKALREKGLVEPYTGRGTFITNGTSQSIRQSLDRMVRIGSSEGLMQLAEARAVMEPEIAALAATRIEEQQLATMREAYAVMEHSNGDASAYVEADLDFHLIMAEATANPIILALVDSVLGILREQRILVFKVKGGPERGQSHHKHILNAIERRDPVKARQAMKAHLEQVMQDSRASSGSGAQPRPTVRTGNRKPSALPGAAKR